MITIIIPTLNAQDTIGQCLESVKEYPVIIIDKFDKAKYGLTIKDYCDDYNNVTYYRQKNNGIFESSR